jgi:hypothetical protein
MSPCSFAAVAAALLAVRVSSQTYPLRIFYSARYTDNVVVASDAAASSLDATYSAFGVDLSVASNGTSPVAGLVPLNLYVNAVTHHHMSTASPAGNAYALAHGFVLQRVDGWVIAVGAQPADALPLTMWYSAARDDHFLVGSQDHAAEAAADGYVAQYVDCYVQRPPDVWTLWPNTPAPGLPFPVSADLTGFQYLQGGNAVPPGIHADTWYPSWDADGNLYSSWTDGTVNNVSSGSGGGSHAKTGFATIIGDDPFNLTIVDVSTFHEPATPYAGRYPSLNFRVNGTWLYGTYALDDLNGDCGNWCVLCPFTSIRTSIDNGATWTDSFQNMTNDTDNLFGETCVNNTKVRMGAPHAVDHGRNNELSPDGRLYMIATGAETPESPESWMQGDSVYLARTRSAPVDVTTVNTAAAWEFWSGSAWAPALADARPLFVWPNRTGVVTMSWHPALSKYIMVVSTPTTGCSTVGNFDTYFLESDTMTGPWALVSYLASFGPEAYFVHVPGKFMGATTYAADEANRAQARARNVRVPRGEPVTEALSADDKVTVAAAAAYYNFFLSYVRVLASPLRTADACARASTHHASPPHRTPFHIAVGRFCEWGAKPAGVGLPLEFAAVPHVAVAGLCRARRGEGGNVEARRARVSLPPIAAPRVLAAYRGTDSAPRVTVCHWRATGSATGSAS